MLAALCLVSDFGVGKQLLSRHSYQSRAHCLPEVERCPTREFAEAKKDIRAIEFDDRRFSEAPHDRWSVTSRMGEDQYVGVCYDKRTSLRSPYARNTNKPGFQDFNIEEWRSRNDIPRHESEELCVRPEGHQVGPVRVGDTDSTRALLKYELGVFGQHITAIQLEEQSPLEGRDSAIQSEQPGVWVNLECHLNLTARIKHNEG